MAKAGKIKVGKNKKPRVKNLKRRGNMNAVRNKYDLACMEYANLLIDPCNAKIVRPLYDGPSEGFQVRLRTITIVGGGSETAGTVIFNPVVNSYIQNGAALASTAFTVTSNTAFGFLVSTSTAPSNISFRCTAACMKVITNASEMNRSGVCYFGNCAGDLIIPGASTTVATVQSALPNSQRTPQSSTEIVWLPTEGSSDTWATNINTIVAWNGEYDSLAFAYSGDAAAAGFTVELTAVYEVQYSAAGPIGFTSGIVNTISKPPSRNSLKDALGLFYDSFGSTVKSGSKLYQAVTGSSFVGDAIGAIATLAI
jgi:hypothetical protein